MDVVIEEYQEADLREIMEVWNEVVAESNAFPQDKALTEEEARAFFGKQDVTAVAKWDGKVAGLYILHPNNVGRCGHQANASYAVSKKLRGRNVGEQHSLEKAKELNYKLLIFNAVVKGNDSAVHLYQKLGFQKIGEVPGGFLDGAGEYRDTILFYHKL